MDIVDSTKNAIKSFSPNNLVYILVPVVLLIILYASFFPLNTVYIGETHDILSNSMYFSLLHENYFATWNNLWAGGFPLTAGPGSDRYYPLSVPFYLIFQNLTIVNFIILLHVLIAYFAFFKLGSLITKNYPAVMIFSLFFAFSGIIFGRIGTGHHLLLYGIAWLPLLYYFFFKIVMFDEPTVMNTIFLSIVSVLIYLTGNIYHFVLAYLVIFIFCLYYALTRQLSRKILYYLVLSLILTTLLVSVKAIPDLGVSGSIIRVDAIDPLEGGGSLETDLASFVTGTPVDSRFSKEETTVMVGIIPLLLMIIGLVYGKKGIIIPSYFAFLFSILWAGAGKSVLSFIHLFPIVDNFRVPGRIFGAILPVVLVIALYGTVLLYEKIKRKETFELSLEQKRNLSLGVAGIIIVKLLELPYETAVSFEALVPVILIAGFILLLYSRWVTFRNILCFFGIAIAANCALLLRIDSFPSQENLVKLLFVGILFIGFFLYVAKNSRKNTGHHVLCGILIISLFLVFVGNIGYVRTFDPGLANSPAINVTESINQQVSANAQVWVFENGWAFQHMDFTYWDVAGKIHPMNLYLPYYLKTIPLLGYTLGNVTYSSADYIVDTLYLENGNQNLPEYSFKVNNISVYRPEHVLPTVFFVRDNLVYPLAVEKYSADTVVASGAMKKGDVVVLKSAFYPGWTANGASTISVGNMNGIQLQSDTDTIAFTFDPLDYKIGVFLTLCGIILLAALIIKRNRVQEYLSKLSGSEPVAARKTRKKSKP